MEGAKAAREMHPTAPLLFLWLGSSVGNLDEADAVAFVADLFAAAGPNTQLLLCTDLWKEEAPLKAAYDDSKVSAEGLPRTGPGLRWVARRAGGPPRLPSTSSRPRPPPPPSHLLS